MQTDSLVVFVCVCECVCACVSAMMIMWCVVGAAFVIDVSWTFLSFSSNLFRSLKSAQLKKKIWNKFYSNLILPVVRSSWGRRACTHTHTDSFTHTHTLSLTLSHIHTHTHRRLQAWRQNKTKNLNLIFVFSSSSSSSSSCYWLTFKLRKFLTSYKKNSEAREWEGGKEKECVWESEKECVWEREILCIN